ncbi:cyclin N-terminal domain-containing protein 1-like [Aphis craccivora]|uniref:Cyclin N-terminal domain-containing protein 1-like n=1 Tax=Aphis craccivora TaxID=307492 RepID=A0A6G0Z0K7_APHCR|nr:cyclin N-terminal domain-containing protein 1-like [Aphis craccivora]
MKIHKEYNEKTYVVEWLKLYKKSIQNFKTFYFNGTYPYRSFSPKVVEFIFNLANELGVDSTVKYQCVELYDRFLSEYFIYKHKKYYNNHSNEWLKILKQCKKKSCLRIISCMLLLSKYAQQSVDIKFKDIKAILQRTGHIYTKKNIRYSETEVLRIVGYKLNEPSIFMLVEYFIDVIPFITTDSLYSTCLLLTDFVYIYHQELYDRLQNQKTGYKICTYSEKLELLDVEYDKTTTAAAVIVTAFYILNSTDQTNEELCLYLSTLCDKSIDNLLTISTVLISIINSISSGS